MHAAAPPATTIAPPEQANPTMFEMFENICTLPLSADLFAQATHPTEPLLAVGLSSGHVQSFRLPSTAEELDDEDGAASVVSAGTGTIDTEWRTRRHKGSCRALAFSGDGEVLYSAGTDGLLKVANSATGQVVVKLAVPSDSSLSDPPTLIQALSPQTLLLATDSSALHLYDLRAPTDFRFTRPAQTHRPHDDYISSLTPLAPSATSTSGFSKQWVTTGGTTLAVTDLRRGVLVKSEDQEDELLTSVFVGGLPSRPGRSKGEKVLVGNSSGVLTLWERGVWDDQDERIYVCEESLDSLVVVPAGVGDGGKNVVVGSGEGMVRVVKLGLNKVVAEFQHDEVEGVVGLGFDAQGRMISGGGAVVKVWQETAGEDEEEGSESEEEEEDDSSEDERPPPPKRVKKGAKEKSIGSGVLGFDLD